MAAVRATQDGWESKEGATACDTGWWKVKGRCNGESKDSAAAGCRERRVRIITKPLNPKP